MTAAQWTQTAVAGKSAMTDEKRMADVVCFIWRSRPFLLMYVVHGIHKYYFRPTEPDSSELAPYMFFSQHA